MSEFTEGGRDRYVERITAAYRKTLEGIFETGDLLAQAKAELKHGEFLAMVEDLPFRASTAERFMKIAADTRIRNSAHVQNFPPHWGTLYELTKLDDKGWAEVEPRLHPEMTRKEVVALRRKIDPPPSPTPRSPLRQHLGRIRTGGIIKEVLFDPDLSTVACTPENDFFVQAPALDGINMPKRFGLRALDVVARMAGMFPDEKPRIETKDGWYYLCLGPFAQICTDPGVVASRPSDKDAKAFSKWILREKEDGRATTLTSRTVRRVGSAIRSLQAKFLTLSVSGRKVSIIIGTLEENLVVMLSDLPADAGQFDLVLNAQHVMQVLRVIGDEETVLVFSGQHREVVGIEAGGYVWAFAPLDPGSRIPPRPCRLTCAQNILRNLWHEYADLFALNVVWSAIDDVLGMTGGAPAE